MSFQGSGPTDFTPSIPASLGAKELYQLAQTDSRMWAAIAAHPNAYPDLLDWLERVGSPQVKAAVTARKNPATTTSSPPLPSGGVQVRSTPTGMPVARPAPTGIPVARPGPAPSTRPTVAPLPGARPTVPPLPTSKPTVSPAPSSGFQVAAEPPRVPVTPPDFRGSPFAARPGTPPVPSSSPAPTRGVPPTPGRVQPTPSTQDDVQDQNASVQQPPVDKTVLAKRSKRAKTLALLDWGQGSPTLVVKEEVIIGRRVPKAMQTDANQVVEIADPTKTVSAKHARLKRVGGQWFIEDLDSTNGIFVVDESGAETEVDKLAPVTSKFYLGDVLFHLDAKG